MKKELSTLFLSLAILSFGFFLTIGANQVRLALSHFSSIPAESQLADIAGPIPSKPSTTAKTCCFLVYGTDDPRLKKFGELELEQTGGCNVKATFTADHMSKLGEAQSRYQCDKLQVIHYEHGPVCQKVADLAKVCVRDFPSCDISVSSVSCQSFKNTEEAKRHISKLQLLAGPNQKITVTGNQPKGIFGFPTCTITTTFTVTKSNTTCEYGKCAEPGDICGPIGGSFKCSELGERGIPQRTSQRCCAFSDSSRSIGGNPGYWGQPGKTCQQKPPPLRCEGPPPYNASPCRPDILTNLIGPTKFTLVPKCSETNVKCELTCPGGDIVNHGGIINGDYCAPPQCTGKPLFTSPGDKFYNTTICDGDKNGLTQNVDALLVDTCTEARKCEYTCPSGAVVKNDKCVKASCTGAIPDAAELCSLGDIGLLKDTPRTLAWYACVPENKCEYQCKANYFFDSYANKCVQVPTLPSQPPPGQLCPTGAISYQIDGFPNAIFCRWP